MSLSSSTSHSNCLSSIAVACAVAILAMSPALPAHAQSSTPSEQPLVHLQHTTWTLKDGMPGPVMAIAQTTDGYLWLGTGAGLFRFDGVRFERFDALAGESLPSRQVLSLFATKDNALWVGLLDGGTALVRAGRILHVDPAKDHFSFSTRGFAAERDGTLWVATGRSLLKRRGNAWTPVGVESGYGNGTPMGTMSIEVDARDNLWVVTDRGMYVKPAGTTRFTAVDVPGLGQAQLALDAAGRAWANDRSDAVRGFLRLPLPGEAAGPYHAVPKSFFMPAFDRAGRLWYGAKDGLNRIEVLDTPAIPPAIAGGMAGVSRTSIRLRPSFAPYQSRPARSKAGMKKLLGTAWYGPAASPGSGRRKKPRTASERSFAQARPAASSASCAWPRPGTSTAVNRVVPAGFTYMPRSVTTQRLSRASTSMLIVPIGVPLP